MKNTYYITTAIPYVNAAPHIGFAMELVQADIVARYHRELLGQEVALLSGADENALKNVQAAAAAGYDTQTFVDQNSTRFQELAVAIGARIDVFQKGSNQTTHFPSSQKLWQMCQNDIYEKEYEGLYCTGCEVFYTESELNEQAECFEHPGKRLELIAETNYFFRLSAYQKKLIALIESDTLAIAPHSRKNEVLSFLKQPLQDISISRSNERAKNWGVPVPDDQKQRIYVWFDALNIYQSGIGFGWDEALYTKWWPADVHVIGKGIIRFHAVYWPAFLMSAGLELPKSLLVHGYITVEGQKMSKSIGNVIDPFEIIKRYGADSTRYYLAREIPTFGDGDFSHARFRELYNADLANGIGNLTARITTLCQDQSFALSNPRVDEAYMKLMDKFELSEALRHVQIMVSSLDKFINDHKPWSITDEGQKSTILQQALQRLHTIAYHLIPFMPTTAQKIIDAITADKVIKTSGLFPRLES